jgi:hypothetical protein
MNNDKTQRNDGSKVVAGIILVGVGIVLLLRNIGFLFPHWLFNSYTGRYLQWF